MLWLLMSIFVVIFVASFARLSSGEDPPESCSPARQGELGFRTRKDYEEAVRKDKFWRRMATVGAIISVIGMVFVAWYKTFH